VNRAGRPGYGTACDFKIEMNFERHAPKLIGIGIVALALFIGIVVAQEPNVPRPLEPPDTSSPRATINTLIALTTEGYGFWASREGRSYRNLAERMAIASQLSYCFDLNDIPPWLQDNVARETAVYLREIFDRIQLPPMDDIPDAAAIAKMPGGLPQWTIPHTEIVLVRIKDGLRAGQYVFSSETDERARDFYLRAKHLPYKPGATIGLYDFFTSEPGWLIPRPLIQMLPAWMKARWGDHTIWQWCGLVLTLLAAAAVMFGTYRLGGEFSGQEGGARYYLGIVFPILAMLVPTLASYFLDQGVFITGKLFIVIAFTLDLISLGALVVVIIGVANRLAAAVGSLSWFRPRSVDAQLAQLGIRICGLAGSVVAILEGGRYLGVPLTTLVAGASVSGLAVALAAQDALKNLFGGFMIILDKPFEVGDTIKIKSYEGKVELVGLRSTKLRLATGHIVTISNAEIASSDSENISRRAHLRRSDTLRLKSGTSLEKIQQALEIVRAALKDHEGSDRNFPATVYVSGISPDVVTLVMTYWYHPPDSAKFAAFNERLNLTLLKQFQAAGISLA
jgi:MscS family membrane protein